MHCSRKLPSSFQTSRPFSRCDPLPSCPVFEDLSCSRSPTASSQSLPDPNTIVTFSQPLPLTLTNGESFQVGTDTTFTGCSCKSLSFLDTTINLTLPLVPAVVAPSIHLSVYINDSVTFLSSDVPLSQSGTYSQRCNRKRTRVCPGDVIRVTATFSASGLDPITPVSFNGSLTTRLRLK